jgi:8-amino-7-oxononanoate synthase
MDNRVIQTLEKMDRKLCQSPLEQTLQTLLERRRTNSTLRKLTLPTANQIDFSSNDFLSLSRSPQLKSLYLHELQKTNISLGSGGSRLLDGNSTYAEELEHDIARFHGAEAGLLFNSGFDANAGFFACVPQPNDIIVHDELVHASVHDGMRLSRACGVIAFRHNSIEDLRRVLRQIVEEKDSVGGSEGSVIVAVESIYSMDGDVAPLKGIVEAVEEVVGRERGYIVVDEAHSTGVLGSQGRGLVSELGLEDRMFARLHTFGKALACNGGELSVSSMFGQAWLICDLAIILGSHTLREYLINYARSLIYTTFMSYPALALIKSSYALFQSGGTTALQQHLHGLTETLYIGLKDLHSRSRSARRTLIIPSACPQSPIFAVQLKRPKQLASALQASGMMVRAVVPPTVPHGTERVRICLHAGNTVLEVSQLVALLEEWCHSKLDEINQEVPIVAKL